MIFLAPWAGLVGAAIALPVLVVFYLLKLRRRPVRVSSTLLWERATHDLQVNAPLRWLRPSWLLLIQFLALLAFLAALARPSLKDAGLSASRIVIVIDRSASMSARDGREPPPGRESDWTRLDEAKARAEDLARRIGRAGGGSRAEAMVVALAASAQTIAPFTSSPSTLIDAIHSITPTDQPATQDSLRRVLRAVGARDEEESADGPTALALVYLFSDGSLPGDQASDGPLPQAPGVVLSPVRVGPDPTPSGGMDNLGIVAINARRDYDDPAQVRLFLRIQNALARPIDTAIDIRIGDEPVETRPILVPPASANGPGELPISLSFVRTAGGILTARILRADLLDADNTASMVLLPTRKPAVLAAGPAGAGVGGDGRGLDPFLLSALQELDLGRLVVVDRAGLEAMLAQTRTRSAAEDPLAGFDLLVLDRVRPSTLPPIATLSFGGPLPIPGLDLAPLALLPNEPAPVVRFLAWQRTHPVLRDVGLDPVIIAPPMRLTLPAPEADPSLAITPLAQGPDGPLLVLLESRGIRRILAPFELGRTNWGPDISFPVFVANAVEFLALRGQSAAAVAGTTSEAVSVRPLADATTLRVSGPATFSVDVPGPTDASPMPDTASLGVLERAGIYTIAGARPTDSSVAVNLADPGESRLAVVDRARPGQPGGLPATETRASGPRELWPWFVLAGLVLASIEWVLYAARMRT